MKYINIYKNIIRNFKAECFVDLILSLGKLVNTMILKINEISKSKRFSGHFGLHGQSFTCLNQVGKVKRNLSITQTTLSYT